MVDLQSSWRMIFHAKVYTFKHKFSFQIVIHQNEYDGLSCFMDIRLTLSNLYRSSMLALKLTRAS